jgi:hypothetical protein
MPRRFIWSADADRLRAEFLARIKERLRAELAPLLLQIFKYSDLSDAQKSAAWRAEVDRVFREELARVLAAQHALAVEV